MSHLSLGLSKRLSLSSTPAASNSKRHSSVNLTLNGPPQNNTRRRNSSRASGHRRQQAGTPSTPGPDTPSSHLTSDDGFFTPHGMSSSLQSLQNVVGEQQTLIDCLHANVEDLQEQLAARPTEEELDNMRKEWETSEELFAQSQKDNEQKYATIEHLRQYIKALEHKLEEMLGDSWRDCCTLPALPAAHSGSAFASNTPVPRPTTTSSSGAKRGSRNSRNSTTVEAARLRQLRELGTSCEKTNPASALRKLEGIHEAAQSLACPAGPPTHLHANRSTTSTADCLEIEGLMDASMLSSSIKPSPSAGGGAGSKASSRVPSSLASHSASAAATTPASPAFPISAASAHKLAEQVAQLTALVSALPGTLTHSNGEGEQRAAAAAERERAHVAAQKAAMLEMLEAAEQRSTAREMRLQDMLAEAKACSGQMGW